MSKVSYFRFFNQRKCLGRVSPRFNRDAQTDNAGIEPALTNVSAFISYCPAMSTATDDQSANLAPGLLALSHVRSTTIDFIGATYRTLLS